MREADDYPDDWMRDPLPQRTTHNDLLAENARLREALEQIVLSAGMGTTFAMIRFVARAALNPGEKL